MSINPIEETALIEKLQRRLDLGQRLLGRVEELKLGQLKMWVGPVRNCLRLLYGRESAVVQQFPLIDGLLTAEQIQREFQVRVYRLSAFIDHLNQTGERYFIPGKCGKVFIGHGQSAVWRELKDFLQDRLHLPWDEFNREAVAGLTTFERLSEMLSAASFAFLIMTAEDEHLDATVHARENVVHEVGLFQGG